MPSLRSSSVNPSTSSSSSSGNALEIAIIDDHPPIREAIRLEAESTMDMVVTGETGSLVEASQLIEEQEPDVAVVDLSLNDGHSFELLERVQANHPNTRLVVFSLYDEEVYAERALRAGASGYLMKGSSTSEVLTAVRRVAEGDVYLSTEMRARVLPEMGNSQNQEVHFPIDELTDREQQIFQMLGQGSTVEAISDRLGITQKTVHTHRRRAKEKLGYETTDEVITHAAQWILGAQKESDRS